MWSDDLVSWLQHIRTLHHRVIDYSLARIKEVAERLDLLTPQARVILVTGTNGKGSTISAMEAILLASSHKVASFTSPYLLSFNEQIRINGKAVSDATLIVAFKMIEAARGDISLSEFEFTTLAALIIFKQTPLDVILFEVGLGGANDATNIITPELTIISSIALDHEEYLGKTLDVIAANEAQLLPPQRKGVIGVPSPFIALTQHAQAISCQLSVIERDFHIKIMDNHWCFSNDTICFEQLPLPLVLCKNAALAIQALLLCDIKFSRAQLVKGLCDIRIYGRLQFMAGKPSLLFDVAHNMEAIENLRTHLVHAHWPAKVIAIFSMFQDKKIVEVIKEIAPYIDHWFIAPIEHPRGASMTQLSAAFQDADVSAISVCKDLNQACLEAKKIADADDLLIVFGSFFVVRAGLRCLRNKI